MRKKRPRTEQDEVLADVSRLTGWTRPRKVVDAARVKLPARRITINLDADIVAVFKAEALRGGPPYQVAINQALRHFLNQREGETRARTVEALLAALDDPAVREKVRRLATARTASRSSG